MEEKTNRKSLCFRLRDAVGWLDYALGDFVEGKTQSVSGNENANRLATAMSMIRELEVELKDLEAIVQGSNSGELE